MLKVRSYRCTLRKDSSSIKKRLIYTEVICLDLDSYTRKIEEADSFIRFNHHPNITTLYSYWVSAPESLSYYKTINMLFEQQRRVRRECVRVLASADDHGIEVPIVVEQPTEIAVLLRVGNLRANSIHRRFHDIADRNDVLILERRQMRSASPTDADAGDIQFLVDIACSQDGGSSEQRTTGRRDARLHKTAASQRSSHKHLQSEKP